MKEGSLEVPDRQPLDWKNPEFYDKESLYTELERVYKMADLYVMPSVSEPFGIAPLEALNVDTDQIIPKQFLKRIERTGFGQFLRQRPVRLSLGNTRGDFTEFLGHQRHLIGKDSGAHFRSAYHLG